MLTVSQKVELEFYITLPNLHRFSQFFHCLQENELLTKLYEHVLSHFNYVATLPCKMDTLENDTNCAELMMNFCTYSISYLLPLSQNVYKLSSFNLCTILYSLIAGRVFFVFQQDIILKHRTCNTFKIIRMWKNYCQNSALFFLRHIVSCVYKF